MIARAAAAFSQSLAILSAGPGPQIQRRSGPQPAPLSLSKKPTYIQRDRASLHLESPRQSFAARRRRNQVKICFSGDMCVGKNTAQTANVRAQRVRCSGLHLFEHVPARARESVDFVDRLKARCSGRAPGAPCRSRRADRPGPGYTRNWDRCGWEWCACR